MSLIALLQIPDTYPSALPTVFCLGPWLGSGHRARGLSWPAITGSSLPWSSWRVAGTWFHSTGYGGRQRDEEPSRRGMPKTLSPPQVPFGDASQEPDMG